MKTGKEKIGKEKIALLEGRDFYWEHELMVLTAAYHRQRGFCCGSGCRNCPYSKEEFERARAERQNEKLPTKTK